MKAVLSVTDDPIYSFLLPIAVYSWNKLGVDCIIMYPRLEREGREADARMGIVFDWVAKNNTVYPIKVKSDDRKATYSQVSRLFACAIRSLGEEEMLITADCDMAVFGDYLLQGNSDRINIYGHDLVDEGQFPMCYISANVKMWRKLMCVGENDYYADLVREFLEPKYCEHFRGNYWALDQETVYNRISEAGIPIYGYSRANHPTRFATRRADRDGWPDAFDHNLVDAHLPRPGFEQENFKRILSLFHAMYPGDDHTWLNGYREQFLKTIPKPVEE